MTNQRMPAPLLITAIAGATIGAMAETLHETIKKLRAYAGSNFDKELDALETESVRRVENAPFDGISEADQLALVDETRTFIRALFRDARKL